MFSRSFVRCPVPGAFIWLFLLGTLALPQAPTIAQTWERDAIIKAEGYQTPPDAIAEAALAPRYLNVSFSNANRDKTWFLREVGDGLPSISTYAKPYHELGGLFVDFAANRSRSLTTRNNAGIQLMSLDGETVDIQIPDGARVSAARWSPDGEQIAFVSDRDEVGNIYLINFNGGEAKKLTDSQTALSSPIWTKDGKHILCRSRDSPGNKYKEKLENWNTEE